MSLKKAPWLDYSHAQKYSDHGCKGKDHSITVENKILAISFPTCHFTQLSWSLNTVNIPPKILR
jgi:hypothetical protein